MKRRSLVIALFYLISSLFTPGVNEVHAQYYDWGPSPANVKWRTIKTPDVKLVFPADFEADARRVMWYLDTVRTHIDYGFRHGTMRTPVVIHTQNTQGNGMVMWAPKRIELLAAPGATYSEPWLKQLAIHEYRHNVQFNNLRRGVMRPLTWLLGEQIAFAGSAQFSIYITEGDAVMAETELSAFGRGLQPSWTMHYRAAQDVGTRNYAGDYWFSGSFRDYVPDHYRVGYQMVRWSYDHFREHIWDDVAHYVARNPQFIVPLWIRMKRDMGMSQTQLFRRAFADLNAHWQSLPKEDDSSVRIETPENSYTTYRWPLWVDDNTIVAFKSDLTGTNRLVSVAIDGADEQHGRRGNEKILGWTGLVSSRPALDADGVLWWTEFRRSLLWPERVSSRLVSRDLASGHRRTHSYSEQVLYPTPAPRDIAYVVYDYSGRFSIVNGNRQLDLPHGVEVTGLAWDDTTDALYFIGLDDGGMFLGKTGAAGSSPDRWERITPSRHITISDLRAGGGRLYFGSIVSGKDEAHCYDLATGTEYRLSTSTYGSFHPSTPRADGHLALTTYDRHGYHLALQSPASATPQERRSLPVDLVNPAWRRWDVTTRMDSLVYTPEAAERSTREHKPRRFSKMANIFQPHSWVPADFYPPDAISEADLTANLGATIISQSLLSDAVSWLAYGWNPRAESMMRGGLSYRGLGPTIDVDFNWGGAPQTHYTAIPGWLNIADKKHLAVTTRISLPMTVSSGRWYSSVTPSAEYHYSNGLLFRQINDHQGKLTRGLERLTVSLRYSGQTRTALSEFLPRWGLAARVSYVTNPTNSDFAPLRTASFAAWLPGIVRPHSLKLQFAIHQTPKNSNAPLAFQMKEVFPRGARYNFSTRQWRSTSIDYQLPVWYPEGGITSIIYFKRVRLNLFADYALWKGPGGHDKFNRLLSYGADIIIDMNPLRLPATNHLTTTITLARPSDTGNLFLNVSLAMPF